MATTRAGEVGFETVIGAATGAATTGADSTILAGAKGATGEVAPTAIAAALVTAVPWLAILA